MKQLKQQLLFILGAGVEFLQPDPRPRYMTYKQLYWRLKNYRQVSVRGAINELIVSGMVERIVRGRQSLFRLTKVGREFLAAKFPVLRRGKRRWDLTWRVVMWGKEKIRLAQQRQLRRMLENLGFVRIKRGVYVSSLAVTAVVKERLVELKLLGAVTVWETKRLAVGDDRAFAAEVWGLDTIYNKYQQLISQSERVLYKTMREKGFTDQLKNDYRKVLLGWFEVLKTDPGAPKQLLPSDWPLLEAKKLMEKLAESVRGMEETGEESK